MHFFCFPVSVCSKRRFSSSVINTIQRSYLHEPCIRVNSSDEPIGMITKEDCHKSPILHRAFSVFLFNTKKELLLQRRSTKKITFPSVWTNSCCSHPHFNKREMEMADESIGVRRAAFRKLYHELGIEITEKMHVMGRFIYQAKYDAKWSEHELDYAIVSSNFNGVVKPNYDEVLEFKFIEKNQLEYMMCDSSNKFSPWFALFTKFQWLNLWWSNLDNLEQFKITDKIFRLN